MLHIHFNRVYTNGDEIPVERDATAFDAVRCVNSDFWWGGVITEVSATRLVMKTGVAFTPANDVNTYTGTSEELLPVLEAAYYHLIRRKQDVSRIKELLGERSARRTVFANWRRRHVPWKALALGMPLGIEQPADMCVVLSESERMDVSGRDLDTAFAAWRREGGDVLEVFTRILGTPAERRQRKAAERAARAA